MSDTSTRVLNAICPETFVDAEGSREFDAFQHAGAIVSQVSEAKYRTLRERVPRDHDSVTAGTACRPAREVSDEKQSQPRSRVREGRLAPTKGEPSYGC